MQFPIPLTNLLEANAEAIAPIIQPLIQGTLIIDCTNIEDIPNDFLDKFYQNFPDDWTTEQFLTLFNRDTCGDLVTQKLDDWLISQIAQPIIAEIIEQKETSEATLDIFNLRDEIIGDYRSYITSFLKIQDPKVKEFVHEQLDQGQLWKDPLVQINPAYQESLTIKELVTLDILHPDCRKYFPGYHFYYHQEQAFRAYHQNLPYVLTTGTGSGKSLSYVVPIIDDLHRHPTVKGVRAILVYPMNALINSQEGEFKKFFEKAGHTHIRVEKYTGQESSSKKNEIQNNPPQILLTN